jgi:tetratricopeptide (TPR) repeat protein
MRSETRSYALVTLVAIAVHAAALGAGFVWLDHAHIEDGLALARSGEFWSLFSGGFAGTGFYRPLMAASLSLDAALGGAPWLYHATTLAWHAAASVLTVIAGADLGLSRRAALVAGVLFAVHPATSLVADAIAFRSESMIAVALLALVISHRREQPWIAALALLAGALTKETAIVLGPLFVLALEVPALRGNAVATGRHRLLWIAEGAALVSALALRAAFAPSWRAHALGLPLGQAVGTRLASLGRSALRVLLPVDSSVCDSFAVSSVVSPAALGGAVVAAGLAWLAYRRRGPAVFLALSILPSLQLVPVMRWWSPHYLYVPLAFAAMLAADAIDRWGTMGTRVAYAVAAGLAVISFAGAFRYKSDATLWEPEVESGPICREAHFYLAETARQAHRLDDAADHYETAIATSPGVLSYVDVGAALQNLGVVRLDQGRFDDARAAFRGALEVVSDEGERRQLTHNLATAELRAGHADEAARLLELEVERPDAMPASIFIRARAVHALGRREEADALVRRLQGHAPSPSP